MGTKTFWIAHIQAVVAARASRPHPFPMPSPGGDHGSAVGDRSSSLHCVEHPGGHVSSRDLRPQPEPLRPRNPASRRAVYEPGRADSEPVHTAPVENSLHRLQIGEPNLDAAAIEVHRDKGPGLIESIYEWCLMTKLGIRGLAHATQKTVLIEYKGFTREEPLRFDLLVEDCVLVEAKAVERVLPIHKAQLLSYMKLLNVPVGLLINFHEIKVSDGISRLILPGANR